MSNLTAFFAQNAIQIENKKIVVSKRFLDEKGNPILWEIRCLTNMENEQIRNDCTKMVKVPGKKGQYTPEIDTSAYMGKVAAFCTVFPNLNDAELQNSYGVMGADAVLKTMLTPGEYNEYLTQVQMVNGFDISMDDKVEEAKN